MKTLLIVALMLVCCFVFGCDDNSPANRELRNYKEFGADNFLMIDSVCFIVKKDGKVYCIERMNITNDDVSKQIDITEFVRKEVK